MNFVKTNCWTKSINNNEVAARANLKMAISYCHDSLHFYKQSKSRSSIFIAIAISSIEKALMVK